MNSLERTLRVLGAYQQAKPPVDIWQIAHEPNDDGLNAISQLYVEGRITYEKLDELILANLVRRPECYGLR